MMINDPLIQAGLGFLAIAVVGALMSFAGWLMSRNTDNRESMPELEESLKHH